MDERKNQRKRCYCPLLRVVKGNTEPKVVASFSQAALPVDRAGKSTYPPNLPQISPAYKICMDKGGAKVEGIANERLAQLKTHPMEESQPLTLLMTLRYARRQESSTIVSQRLPSVEDGHRCRVPQTNTRQS